MHHSSRRAFTLIELLVVIAIIAILAAILFPVFAQAREKARQISCVSNAKQLGTAFSMYVQDYDETFPMGWGWSTAAPGWATNFWHGVPANWRALTQFRSDAYPVHWSNSTQPYIKNYNVLACPSGTTIQLGGVSDYASPKATPAPTAYTYNGLLSSYGEAGVNTPAGLILLWEGQGKANVSGFALSNPALSCPDPNSPCVYQPRTSSGCASGNGGTGGMFGPSATMWVHTGGANFVMADSHAKWRRLGAGVNSPTDANTDPFTNYNATGVPTSYWWNGCHAWLFRPDAQF